jgi:hypothetical protein
MNKIEKFDWAKPGDRGRNIEMPICDLLIDHSYQRMEVSAINTLAIAKNFNWTSFGTLTIMRRENGACYVIDGQQRLAAIKKRGDIIRVPCRVFDSDGPEHEAIAFVAINVNRKSVSAVSKFNANFMGGHNPEVEIGGWLKENNLRISDNSDVSRNLDFPAKIIATWNADRDSCKSAILIQLEINQKDESLNSFIHAGIWWLLYNGIDVEKEIQKLKNLGGKPAILQSIRRLTIESGMPKASINICGRGTLLLINRHRRNKISIMEK